MTKLSMTRGDTPVFQIVVSDENGPLDLEGKVLRFTAKKNKSFQDAAALFRKSTSDGSITVTAEGIAEVQLHPEDTVGLTATTHRFYYDVQLSSEAYVYTLVSGLLIITPDITQS